MACKAAPSEPNVPRLASVDQQRTSAPNPSSGAEQGRRLASSDKLTSDRACNTIIDYYFGRIVYNDYK